MAASKHSDSTAEKPNAKWYGSAASANNAYAARLSLAGKGPPFARRRSNAANNGYAGEQGG